MFKGIPEMKDQENINKDDSLNSENEDKDSFSDAESNCDYNPGTWFDRSHKTSSATVTAQMSKDIFSGAVSMVATACNVPP